MSEQLSAASSPEGPTSGLRREAVAVVGFTAGVAVAWLLDRRKQRALEERTERRLRPKPPTDADIILEQG